MKILDLCEEERPREKLAARGSASLTNAELIAVLLRSGTGKENAVEIAHRVLAGVGGKLGALASMSVEALCSMDGIGMGKAAALLAALELGKRFAGESFIDRKVSITGSEMVFRLMFPIMKGLMHEECWIVYLNRANYMIGKERLSSGGLSATVMDVRIIVRKAIEKMASGIIMVHNHPSGNPYPGTQDMAQTEKLRKALDTFEISLLDHIIIADNRYYSFADEVIREEKY